jgi:hypothetical protein
MRVHLGIHLILIGVYVGIHFSWLASILASIFSSLASIYANIAAITCTHPVANWVTSSVHTPSLDQGLMISEYRTNGSSILVLNYSIRILFYWTSLCGHLLDLCFHEYLFMHYFTSHREYYPITEHQHVKTKHCSLIMTYSVKVYDVWSAQVV